MADDASRVSDDLKPQPRYSHPTQLDLYSLHQLPDSHAWTSSSSEQDYNSNTCNQVETESIPVVDLNDDNASQLLGRACRTWGIFQVKNHGIPTGSLLQIESLAQRLFSLPMEQKLRAARSPGDPAGYGVAQINSYYAKVMWHEGFTIWGSPFEHAPKLWPDDYNTFWYIFNFHPPLTNKNTLLN